MGAPTEATVGPSIALLVATFSLSACAHGAVRGSGFCAPPARAAAFPSDPVPPGASRVERTAALLGLRALFPDGARDEATRMEVLAHIEAARLAIAGTRAEIDCAGESVRQVADHLAHAQSNAVQSLTVGSIAVAAATSIVSVFLSTGGASRWTQNGFAIGGGALTAGLGLASLYVHPFTVYEHQRNLLADVWFGPKESSTYPPIVWGYLTQPEFSNEQRAPIRVKIVERWKQFQDIKDDRETVTLFFGAGGSYDVEALRTRAAMLDEVKAEVDLMNQEIAALAARLLNLPESR